MYDRKLSIIIPTRNRQKYAAECIRTILNYGLAGLEVVVQDNSDDDQLKDMIGDLLESERLRYSYSSECLSFCANFENAVEISTGDYLIIIGDDDCVLPEIVELTDVLRERKIDSAVFSTQTSYIWPNAVSSGKGKLVIRRQKHYVKKFSTNLAVKKMIESGNYDYQNYEFPKVYHGIVRREKLDLVREKTGHYFGGLTPDIYSAVALSFYIKSGVFLNVPFTLPGICARSGSADSLTGRHTGELEDAPHFRGHDAYQWAQQVPRVYSVDTIWAETAFKAIIENGGAIELSTQSLYNFLVYIANRSRSFVERLAKFYEESSGIDSEKTARLLVHSASRLKRRAFMRKSVNFALQVLKGRFVYKNVDSIKDAVVIMEKKKGRYDLILEKIRYMEL